MNSKNFQVTEFSPTRVKVEVTDVDKLAAGENRIRLGSYLVFKDRHSNKLVAVVVGFSVRDPLLIQSDEIEPLPKANVILETQPLALIDHEDRLHCNCQQLTLPPTEVKLAKPKLLRRIYSLAAESETAFSLGSLSVMSDVPYVVDGNRLLGKHIAVVGSTGSGKSCTVASLLQKAVKLSDEKNAKNNSHIIIFDPHAEYAAAFKFADRKRCFAA